MRRYFVFSAICLALGLYAISGSAVAVAFPVITEKFQTSLLLAGWVLSAFQLVSTIVMPLAGKVSELFGRKATFMVCTLLFTAGSLLSAIAPNIGWLIGFRIIQGIGGGGFLPCAAGIVSDEFPESRQRFIGFFTTIFTVGMIIGPNLGGWMVETFGWQSIFWFNVPLGLVILVLLQILLRSGEKLNTNSSIDYRGAWLLFGSVLAFMLVLTALGNAGSGLMWLLAGGLFAVSIWLMAAFIRQERRANEPIINLELLKKRPFMAANIYNTIYGLTALGVPSLIPLYAVSIYKMSILESGFIMSARSLAGIIISTITAISLVKWGYRWPLLIGSLAGGLGLFLLAFQPTGVTIGTFHLGVTPLLLIILGILGVSHGISTPASSNACIELMPEKVATITGLRGMFRQLGSTMGIAIGTLLVHSITSAQQAFFTLMFASAVILLISIPSIFAMPASPNASVQKQSATMLKS